MPSKSEGISSITITSSVLLFTILSCHAAQRPGIRFPVEQCSNTPLVISANNFGASLTKNIGGRNNLFISPFSIYAALAITYLGAKGQTAREIENAFHLTNSSLQGTQFHESFRKLINVIVQGNNEYTLLLANGIFVQQNFKVEDKYLYDVAKYYNAAVKMVDFVNSQTAAKNEINKFVADNTRNKIDKFLSQPLSPRTVLALLNAIYFKGTWKTQFPKEKTKEAAFYKNDRSTKTVKYMILENKNFLFFEDSANQYKFLELPYKGGDISMLLALPNSNIQAPDLNMNSELLCKIYSQLRSTKVNSIWLPKFRLKYRTELNVVLKQLGIQELFTPSADLSGIRRERDIAVSTAIHEAVIDVNEEGSEAAAATGIFMIRLSLMLLSTFHADHPFSFYIIDKRNGLILFSGRLSDP